MPVHGDSYRYAVRVKGHLDAHWSEWLEGMTITHEEGGTTLLEGAVPDQPALLSLLCKLGDLHLLIVGLQRREPVSCDGSPPEEPPGSHEVTDRTDA